MKWRVVVEHTNRAKWYYPQRRRWWWPFWWTMNQPCFTAEGAERVARGRQVVSRGKS